MSRVERYSPEQLRSYLEALGFERVDYGSGHIYYLTPDGTKIPAPGHGTVVTIAVGAQVASLLGTTRQQLTSAVTGSDGPSKTGRMRRGIGKKQTPQVGRLDVVRSVDEVARLAASVKASLKGQRDPSHYRRLLVHTSAAKAELSRAAEATRPGGLN